MATHKRYLKKGMLAVQVYMTQDHLAYLQSKAAEEKHRGSVSAVIRDALDIAMRRAGKKAVVAGESRYEPFNVA